MDQSTPPEIAVLLEGRIPDLKPLRARLRSAGIDAELMTPPGGCKGG